MTVEAPQLAKVYEIGTVGDSTFMANEFIAGWSFDEVIEAARAAQKMLPLGVVLEMGKEALRGLAVLHRAVHPKTGASLEVVGASSSATALDPRKFHAELSDPGGRVAFTIVVRDRTVGTEWTIRLPLTADHAVLVAGRDSADAKSDPDTTDLDDAGRRDSPW